MSANLTAICFFAAILFFIALIIWLAAVHLQFLVAAIAIAAVLYFAFQSMVR